MAELHSIVTRDGYVSQSPAPHFSVPSDHAMLQQFAEFLENRLQTENLGLLRRIFADFLLEHEHTLLQFLDLAATIIVVKPFSQTSARRRCRAAALLDMPKRPLHERGCVFFYLANRVHSRNMALLKLMFLEFLAHGETLIERFVARGDSVISVIPARLPCAITPTPIHTQPPPPAPREVPVPLGTNARPAAAQEAPTVPTTRASVPIEVVVEEEHATIEEDSSTQASLPRKSVDVALSPRSPTNYGATTAPAQQPASGVERIPTSGESAVEAPLDRQTQEQPRPQASVASTPPKRRAGRPKKVRRATFTQQTTANKAGSATRLGARPTFAATAPRVGRPTAFEATPAVAARAPVVKPDPNVVQRPPKRKRGRPKKIKTEEVFVTPAPPKARERAPGKRQIRHPDNFAESQAADMFAAKRVKRESEPTTTAPATATDVSGNPAKPEHKVGVKVDRDAQPTVDVTEEKTSTLPHGISEGHFAARTNSRNDMSGVASFPALDRAKLRFLQRQARRLRTSSPRAHKHLLSSCEALPVQQAGLGSSVSIAATDPSAPCDVLKRRKSEIERAADLLAVFCLDLDRDLTSIDSDVQSIGVSIRHEHEQVLASLESAISTAITAPSSLKSSRSLSRVRIQRYRRPRIKLVIISESNVSENLHERLAASPAPFPDPTTKSAVIIQSKIRGCLYNSLYQGGRVHFEQVCVFRRRNVLARTWKAWLQFSQEWRKARLRRLELVLQRLDQKSGEWRRTKAPLIMEHDGKYGVAKQFSAFATQCQAFRAWLSVVVTTRRASVS